MENTNPEMSFPPVESTSGLKVTFEVDQGVYQGRYRTGRALIDFESGASLRLRFAPLFGETPEFWMFNSREQAKYLRLAKKYSPDSEVSCNALNRVFNPSMISLEYHPRTPAPPSSMRRLVEKNQVYRHNVMMNGEELSSYTLAILLEKLVDGMARCAEASSRVKRLPPSLGFVRVTYTPSGKLYYFPRVVDTRASHAHEFDKTFVAETTYCSVGDLVADRPVWSALRSFVCALDDHNLQVLRAALVNRARSDQQDLYEIIEHIGERFTTREKFLLGDFRDFIYRKYYGNKNLEELWVRWDKLLRSWKEAKINRLEYDSEEYEVALSESDDESDGSESDESEDETTEREGSEDC